MGPLAITLLRIVKQIKRVIMSVMYVKRIETSYDVRIAVPNEHYFRPCCM